MVRYPSSLALLFIFLSSSFPFLFLRLLFLVSCFPPSPSLSPHLPSLFPPRPSRGSSSYSQMSSRRLGKGPRRPSSNSYTRLYRCPFTAAQRLKESDEECECADGRFCLKKGGNFKGKASSSVVIMHII